MFLHQSNESALPSRSFVEPLLGSAHIDVLTFATASKVLMGSEGDARGVRLQRFGKTFEFNARKEVVLSAGAIRDGIH